MDQKDERTWATFAHLAGIVGFFIIPSVGNIIGALVIWLLKRNDSAFVDREGKEALNFQLTVSIATVVFGILMAIRIGSMWTYNSLFFHRGDFDFQDVTLLGGTHGIIWLLNLIFSIVAAIRVNKGESYRYPLNWRIVK